MPTVTGDTHETGVAVAAGGTAHARTSAVSGLAFAVLFTVALVLVHQAPNLSASTAQYAAFYQKGNGTVLVTAGLYVVPFAGIAFLWFAASTRELVRSRALPRTLQLSSGIAFVCLLFAGTALVGAVALLTRYSDNPLPSPDIARALTSAGFGMVFVYGVRAAAMFLITTTTLARRTGLIPTWYAVVSYLAGLFLLVTTTFHPAVLLVFPAWVAAFNVLAILGARNQEAS
jgi:hypothetical protein